MEKVSALMDGELGEDEARGQIARLKHEGAGGDLRHCWDTYHLIGDAMRGDAMLSAGFGSRLSERLAQEPTVLAPRQQMTKRKIYTYAISAAASLSGVALVAWVAVSTGISSFSPTPTELAKAPAAAPVANPAAVVAAASAPAPAVTAATEPEASAPTDGQSTEYLLAHQGISPSTAIQGVAPYIRTVSNISPVEIAQR